MLIENRFLVFILILLSLLASSCVRIYLRAMGVKKARTVDKEVLSNYLDKLNIQPDQILEVDSARYHKLIKTKLQDSSTYKYPNWWVQNHLQPTQVIYFDKYAGKSIAAYFNCIAESSFPFNLTYNKYNELEYFPPLTYSDSKWIDTLFSLNELLGTINDLDTKTFVFNNNGKRYLALIYYSLFVEKQSTNLIRETNTHIRNCIKDSCQVLFINMDNYMFQQMK